VTAPSFLRATTVRWLHPFIEYGSNLMRRGLSRRDPATTRTGLALVVAGWALSRRTTRRLNRRPLYRAELGPGESVRIKVVQDGAEIDVIDVPGD
jgi:hypothetical protein